MLSYSSRYFSSASDGSDVDWLMLVARFWLADQPATDSFTGVILNQMLLGTFWPRWQVMHVTPTCLLAFT